MLRKLQLLTAVVLWFVTFTVYRTLLSHVLYYFDQHHLFIYTRSYVAEIWRREGIGGLLTDFIAQFFHQPLVGSAVLATLLSCTYLFLTMVESRAELLVSKTNAIAGQAFRWTNLLQLPLAVAVLLFFTLTSTTGNLNAIVGGFLLTGMMALIVLLCTRRPAADKGSANPKLAVIPVISAVIILGGAGSYFRSHYNIPERIMLKTQEFAEEGRWDDVLEYSAAYQRSGHNNVLIAYYRSLALAHKGLLTATTRSALMGSSDAAESYLALLGQNALFFPWNSNSRESEYGSLVYEHLGLINEAQHWETEALQVFGMTAPHLIRLAKYAIVTHRPKVADHFICPLRHTLYYRDVAAELERMRDTGEVPGVTDVFAAAPDSISAPFTNVQNLLPQLRHAWETDSTHPLLKEYYQSARFLSPR